MIRSLALTVLLVVVGALSAVAQTHPQSHPPGRPHDRPSHAPLDPAQHAAMHARLHGSWTGTLNSADGVSKKLTLTVAHDKLGKMTLEMSADQPFVAGAASNIAIDAGGLHWMQTFSGASCNATAVLTAGTTHAPETMTGTVACDKGAITFALQKSKG
jgi:hypothetical protein